MAASAIEPARVEKLGDQALKVVWGDGHESLYAWEFLRTSCPCAVCREAAPSAAGVRPAEIKPVGRYAMAIRWSDGHATGIYSHEYLRSICRCESCRPNQMTEG